MWCFIKNDYWWYEATRPKWSTSRTFPKWYYSIVSGLVQDNYEEEDEHHDRVQEERKDQREMRIMGIKEKHHHTQESATMFKEITPSITYLVILKRG
jgi:hypothetical protein